MTMRPGHHRNYTTLTDVTWLYIVTSLLRLGLVKGRDRRPQSLIDLLHADPRRMRAHLPDLLAKVAASRWVSIASSRSSTTTATSSLARKPARWIGQRVLDRSSRPLWLGLLLRYALLAAEGGERQLDQIIDGRIG